MRGMNAHTGRAVDDLDHIRQSVRDILTTRLGSRIMRRDYGSLLPELIDQPLNDATLLRAYSVSIMALLIWDPRLRVTAIRKHASAEEPGRALLELDAITTDGQPLAAEVPLTPGTSQP